MSSPATYQLRSDRLCVEISPPGEAYRGTRFDWTGFITQVTLDGSHTFCVPESYQPGHGTGGIGLCNEFGIDRPVGYAEARPGELFPKLGIGLLRRPDEGPYDFLKSYEIARLFPMHQERGPDWARILVEPVDCRGYAVRLDKAIRVGANWLEITCVLENVGQKPVETHEYVHNFIGIDRQPLGPNYSLRFPYPVQIDEGAATGLEPVEFRGEEVSFNATPRQDLYFRPRQYTLSNQPQWEIQLKSTGTGVREFDDFLPMRVGVWGAAHVLSPEIFVGIALSPGTTQTWKRRFEFFD